jgi:hypothetical protein
MNRVVNFFKRTTENFAHNVNLPVGFVRIAIVALVLSVFFNLNVATGFVVGVVYAIYAHGAISLRSVATRVIESSITRGVLTAVWTLGNWSWSQTAADGNSLPKERAWRVIGTWLVIAILVPLFFGFKAALFFGAAAGACIALTMTIEELNNPPHRPQNLSGCFGLLVAGIVLAAIAAWGISWVPAVGYHGLAHLPFSRILFPAIGAFIGFIGMLPMCEDLTKAVTAWLGYEAEIKGWHAVVRKSGTAAPAAVEAQVQA